MTVMHEVLSMDMIMDALEASYLGVARGSRHLPAPDRRLHPDQRSRARIPLGHDGGRLGRRLFRDPDEVGHPVLSDGADDGTRTQEKYCKQPGLFCGLIFLTSVETGEPLAFINDGVLQHMRVGGDGGLGVKYMAREDASVVGMLGSGGMAETHMQAFTAARDIRRLQVYSPTRANREAFGARMAERYGIEVVVCDAPEQVYRGADIVAALTDAAQPVLNGALLEPGTHVVNIGGGGLPDAATMARVDRVPADGRRARARGARGRVRRRVSAAGGSVLARASPSARTG